MLKQLWNLLVRVTVVAGVLLGFVFLAECFRLFVLFYRIHPAAGFTFAGILLVGILALLIYFWRGLRACPRVLTPPPMPELSAASHAEMRRYCKYLAEYLGRLAENPNLTAEEAIEQSKALMNGYKRRLFCLQFSFIGWYLLAACTGGVGWFFLAPYTKAADTAFYLERTGRLAPDNNYVSPAPSDSAPTGSPAPAALPEEGSGDHPEWV